MLQASGFNILIILQMKLHVEIQYKKNKLGLFG